MPAGYRRPGSRRRARLHRSAEPRTCSTVVLAAATRRPVVHPRTCAASRYRPVIAAICDGVLANRRRSRHPRWVILGRASRTGISIVSQFTSKSHPGASREETVVGAGDAPGESPSGRPVFDRRGTTVWEWQTATGVYSRDASTTRVQSLQVPELSLEKTVTVKQPVIEEPRLNVAPCGGFNPYDNAPIPKSTPVATPPPLRMPPTRPAAMPPRRPTTLRERLRALFTGR